MGAHQIRNQKASEIWETQESYRIPKTLSQGYKCHGSLLEKEDFLSELPGIRERGRKLQARSLRPFQRCSYLWVTCAPVSNPNKPTGSPRYNMGAIISLLHHLSPIQGEQMLVRILLVKVTLQSHSQKPMAWSSLELHAFTKKTAKENTGGKVIALRYSNRYQRLP